jgi:hypothetical protein
VRCQAFHGGRYKLLEGGCAGVGLRNLARLAAEVAARPAGFTQFGRAQTWRRCLLQVDLIIVPLASAEAVMLLRRKRGLRVLR